jgi:hypothetical protein
MNANGVKLRSEGTWEEKRGGKRGVLGLKLEESASNPSATTHPAQTGVSLLHSAGEETTTSALQIATPSAICLHRPTAITSRHCIISSPCRRHLKRPYHANATLKMQWRILVLEVWPILQRPKSACSQLHRLG